MVVVFGMIYRFRFGLIRKNVWEEYFFNIILLRIEIFNISMLLQLSNSVWSVCVALEVYIYLCVGIMNMLKPTSYLGIIKKIL